MGVELVQTTISISCIIALRLSYNVNIRGQAVRGRFDVNVQVRDKPQNAVIVIYGIMVKPGSTVHCHIWYHCQ